MLIRTASSTAPPVTLLPRRAVSRGWGMTMTIAWRNLTHDLVRMAATLVGIVFSVVLMGMQLGLLLNFVHTTATLVDNAKADIWIAAQGVNTVDIATPIQERRRFHTLAVPGVAKAESYVVDFGVWKRANGTRESVIIVGVDPHATMGLPWRMEEGSDAADALSAPNGVIVDRLYAEKLGVFSLGDTFEINDRKVRVTGFTAGIRTFTQSPYVFTSVDNSRALGGRADDFTSYVLVSVVPDHAVADVVTGLRERIKDVDVFPAQDFSARSSNYWLLSTGAGVSLIMSGALGLLVGGVIVAQTLYASTMDRLPQYSTLRAMGGPPGYMNRIVLLQAAISGTIGYVIGIAIVAAVVAVSQEASAAPVLPPWLAGAVGLTTLVTCLLASLVSLSKVNKIDPTKVFR